MASEIQLPVEVATTLQLVDQVSRHTPPGSSSALYRIHHWFEAQRPVYLALQQLFQGLLHRHPGYCHMQLTAVASDRQLLVLVRREDHPQVAVRTQQTTICGQFLFAVHR
ncbi:hypothetical protein D9M72_642930 [compost metagenome]